MTLTDAYPWVAAIDDVAEVKDMSSLWLMPPHVFWALVRDGVGEWTPGAWSDEGLVEVSRLFGVALDVAVARMSIYRAVPAYRREHGQSEAFAALRAEAEVLDMAAALREAASARSMGARP